MYLTGFDNSTTDSMALSVDENVSEFQQYSSVNGDRSLEHVNFIIYVVIVVIGFVFNVVAIVTYSHKLRKSTYIFVFCLAVCDGMNILNVLFEVLLQKGVFPESMEHVLCITQSYLADFGALVSANIVICVALNRYLLAKYKTVSLSRRLCLYLVVGIVFCSFIVTLPFLVTSASQMIDYSSRDDEHSCRRHYFTPSSDVTSMRLSKTSCFLLAFNGVVLAWLLVAFLINIVLYIKLSRHINKMSSERQSHKAQAVDNFNRRDIYNAMENDSAESSDAECGQFYDKNGNLENKNLNTRANHNINGRKSSVISIKFTSITHTKKYIMLVVSAIILFTCYFSHFTLHIISIYHKDVEKIFGGESECLKFIVNCLGHSYILCFVFNPVIYCFFNRRFFKNFKQSWCCLNNRSIVNSHSAYEPKRLSLDSARSSIASIV